MITKVRKVNTLKILNVMYLNEYCTFNGIDMKHYKIAVWANLLHIGSDGYCEFYIRKDNKIIKPRTSETELPSTTVNVSPFLICKSCMVVMIKETS